MFISSTVVTHLSVGFYQHTNCLTLTLIQTQAGSYYFMFLCYSCLLSWLQCYTRWGSEVSLLLRWRCEWMGHVGGVVVGSNDSVALECSVSTAISCRNGLVERAFAVETYFSENKSIFAVQCSLRTRYGIPFCNTVPDRKSILLWGNSNSSQRPSRPTMVITHNSQNRTGKIDYRHMKF